MSNEKLTVIGISGDGDAYGIGLSHFMHSCRRDVNLLYIVCNNENYGLTTGQASPTTPLGCKTKSTPEGNMFAPFHPIGLAEAAGCHFSKQSSSSDVK
jgi:2-oxoglutarate ferredoxin oxidoreductase subunit beta